MQATQRELFIVFWVLTAVRLELVLVLLEKLRVFSMRATGFNQVEQDLFEDNEENHERVHCCKMSLPVGKQ